MGMAFPDMRLRQQNVRSIADLVHQNDDRKHKRKTQLAQLAQTDRRLDQVDRTLGIKEQKVAVDNANAVRQDQLQQRELQRQVAAGVLAGMAQLPPEQRPGAFQTLMQRPEIASVWPDEQERALAIEQITPMLADDRSLRAMAQSLGQELPALQFKQNAEGGFSALDPATGRASSVEGVQAAPDKPLVEVNQKGEDEFAKLMGKQAAEVVTAGRDARVKLARLGQAEGLLDTGLQTGAGKGFGTKVKAFARGMGMDLEGWGIGDDVAVSEAFNALGTEFATAMVSKMKGAVSDREMQMLVDAVPALSRTPGGNRLMIEVMRAAAKAEIEAADRLNSLIDEGVPAAEAYRRVARDPVSFMTPELEQRLGAFTQPEAGDAALESYVRELEAQGLSEDEIVKRLIQEERI